MSRVEQVVAVVLVLLAVGGIVVADTVKGIAFQYWLWMVPVFGLLSLVAAGMRAQRDGDALAPMLVRQLLHWLALGGAVGLLFYLQRAGRLSEQDVSLLALLALALTTFLAGVHGDWRFCIIGLILGAAATAMALLEAYRWAVLIPLGLVALWLVARRRHAESATPTVATAPTAAALHPDLDDET